MSNGIRRTRQTSIRLPSTLTCTAHNREICLYPPLLNWETLYFGNAMSQESWMVPVLPSL